jgi:hypothetical protein
MFVLPQLDDIVALTIVTPLFSLRSKVKVNSALIPFTVAWPPLGDS